MKSTRPDVKRSKNRCPVLRNHLPVIRSNDWERFMWIDLTYASLFALRIRTDMQVKFQNGTFGLRKGLQWLQNVR